MAIVLTSLTSVPKDTGREIHATGILTPSGNYPTGGEDMTSIFRTAIGQQIKSAHAPTALTVNDSLGYPWTYNQTTKKLMLFSAIGTQQAGGAYPGVGTLFFNAWFQRG